MGLVDMMRRVGLADAGDASGHERRRNVRQASLLEVAKLTIGDSAELCRLRDVSADGLCAEIYSPAAKGDRVTIELRTGHVIEGEIIWVRSGEMGVGFGQVMPITEMLSHCSFDERVTSVRAPRLDVEVGGVLLVDNFKQPARVSNISQSGLKLHLDDYFEAETPCTIVIDNLGIMPGEIKWWREREGGLMFDEPIAYPAFAEWRRSLNPDWRRVEETVRDHTPRFPSAIIEETQEIIPFLRKTRRFGQRGRPR